MKNLLFFRLLFTAGFSISCFCSLQAQDTKPAAPLFQHSLYPEIQYFRYYDQRALGVFETSKLDTIPYQGLAVRLGANFTMQYQSLLQSNTDAGVPYPLPTVTNGSPGPSVSQTSLLPIASGFNLSTANLNIDAQLADGIRMNVILYLSSRHHNETWVKGGFIQIDKLKFLNSGLLDRVMKFTTLKFGHYEVNYGDAHYRRSDNGNAIQNPFVDGLLLDAFTTEVGGEAIVQYKGLLAMVGATDGAVQGGVTAPTGTPSYLAKVGFDKRLNDLRVRLTGSVYTNGNAASNSLYGGDRAGSRYYLVMTAPYTTQRNALPTYIPADQTTSFQNGRVNPGFTGSITSFMVNPFIKYKGIELFGTYEASAGSSESIRENNVRRTVTQYAGELIYRFLKREQLFVGARYNRVSGQFLPSSSFVTTSNDYLAPPKQTINRVQVAAGWFLTRNILLRVEYVDQAYMGYDNSNLVTPSILNNGKFHGFTIEGSLGF